MVFQPVLLLSLWAVKAGLIGGGVTEIYLLAAAQEGLLFRSPFKPFFVKLDLLAFFFSLMAPLAFEYHFAYYFPFTEQLMNQPGGAQKLNRQGNEASFGGNPGVADHSNVGRHSLSA